MGIDHWSLKLDKYNVSYSITVIILALLGAPAIYDQSRQVNNIYMIADFSMSKSHSMLPGTVQFKKWSGSRYLSIQAMI